MQYFVWLCITERFSELNVMFFGASIKEIKKRYLHEIVSYPTIVSPVRRLGCPDGDIGVIKLVPIARWSPRTIKVPGKMGHHPNRPTCCHVALVRPSSPLCAHNYLPLQGIEC